MMLVAFIEQISLYIPLMLGSYIALGLMKIPSLSIESAYVFGAVLASVVVISDPSANFFVLIMALTTSFFGGALVGFLSALLAEKAHFSQLLSAIITIGFFHGVIQWVINGTQVVLSAQTNPLKSLYFITDYSESLYVFLIALLLIWFVSWFLNTQLGISCAIYGDNNHFLSSYRINQSYVVIAGLALSNGLVGISGYLVAQNNGFVDSSMGSGIPLFCISSLIIGKAISFKWKHWMYVAIPLIGVVGYFVIQLLLLSVGFNLKYFTAVQALIVACLLIFLSRLRVGSSYQDLLGI